MCTLDGDVREFNNVLSTSGLEYFEPKQTYLVVLEEFVEGIDKKIPLLNKTSELYSTLLLKFKQVPSLPEIEPKKNVSKSTAKSKERLRIRRASRKEVKSGGVPLNK